MTTKAHDRRREKVEERSSSTKYILNIEQEELVTHQPKSATTFRTVRNPIFHHNNKAALHLLHAKLGVVLHTLSRTAGLLNLNQNCYLDMSIGMERNDLNEPNEPKGHNNSMSSEVKEKNAKLRKEHEEEELQGKEHYAKKEVNNT